MATTLSALETQVRRHLVELPTLADPSAPTVTPQGVTGATAYSYKIVAMHRHGQTAVSSAGSTASGNATLSSSNFNRVTWTAVTGATAYLVYRTVGAATTGLIAVVGAVTQLDDTGLTGDTTTAPTVNTTGGRFWSSEELVSHFNNAIKDLWKAIIDLHQEHFQTIDTTNVSQAADAETLTGVPSDVFRVLLIEPRDTTSGGTFRDILYRPKKYNHADFINARSRETLNPVVGGCVLYDLSQSGAPIAAPTVHVAPKTSTEIMLRFVYIPTVATKVAADNNPIPGESDNALIAWCVAYARAKEREDRMPDANWLAIYANEKKNTLTPLTPRQEQEEEVVDDLFDAYM